jgi:uncharacterized protein with HEPN domain
MDFAEYRQDEKTQAAVERKMQILTEAVIRLEMDDTESFPDIDWKGYRGMGNFLRHSYDRVSSEIVWNTVQEDLPALKKIAEKVLHCGFSTIPITHSPLKPITRSPAIPISVLA